MSKQASKQANRPDTRQALVEAGVHMIVDKGYASTGIDAVLKTVGVPKGSFYYYFPSKEAFGLAVLEQFTASFQAKLDRHLENRALLPLERLRHYFEEATVNYETNECMNGCLIGNLGQEMANQSEAFRARINEAFKRWRNDFAGCLREAQEAGHLDPTLDVFEVAEFVLAGWEGALSRTRVTKDSKPMRLFTETLFTRVLQPAR